MRVEKFPSRILMTADTVGGVWTYAIELARALGEHGVTIALATMGAPLSLDQRLEAALLENVVLHESSYKLEWMEDPWGDCEKAGQWLLEIRDSFNPDLVHLNGFVHGNLPWGVPVLVVGHSCVLSWWEAVHGQSAPADWNRYRGAVGAGLSSADMVAAPSHAMLDSLTGFYGPFNSTRVIANGRSPSLFGAADKEPFVLSVGRIWDRAKNMECVARAAPGFTWPCRIAGENEHPGGGSVSYDNVEWIGNLPTGKLSRWYARAAIYALPARYEPFGLTVLEAALSGCALVLGDIPSLRENWDGAAMFVPSEDETALVTVLNSLMSEPEQNRSLGIAARERALQFSPEAMASGYVDAYRLLIDMKAI